MQTEVVWFCCSQCSWFHSMNLSPRVATPEDIYQVVQAMKREHEDEEKLRLCRCN